MKVLTLNTVNMI